MSVSADLAYRRAGAGEPMLLVHGIGHRRQMWDPIIERLQDRFDMVAVDLPGFGETVPLPADQEPTPGQLADHIEALMTRIGWDAAHLVGNSLGGWLALELARRGRARSVTALMPAGVWRAGRGSDSLRHRALFTLWRTLARLPGSPTLIRNPVIRTLAVAGAFGRPWRVPPDVAAGDARNLGESDMRRAMQALAGRRFTGGQHITTPVTVTLGSRDPLIRRRDLDPALLPPQTRLVTIRGVGHVPTWDDADAVSRTVLETAGTHGLHHHDPPPAPTSAR